MEKFWMVYNFTRGGSPTHRHNSKAAAKTEAERLARMCQGEEFVVLESIEFARVPQIPVEWTSTDELPF